MGFYLDFLLFICLVELLHIVVGRVVQGDECCLTLTANLGLTKLVSAARAHTPSAVFKRPVVVQHVVDEEHRVRWLILFVTIRAIKLVVLNPRLSRHNRPYGAPGTDEGWVRHNPIGFTRIILSVSYTHLTLPTNREV